MKALSQATPRGGALDSFRCKYIERSSSNPHKHFRKKLLSELVLKLAAGWIFGISFKRSMGRVQAPLRVVSKNIQRKC